MNKYFFFMISFLNLIPKKVLENYDPRMYFGWWHPNSEPNHPNITSRPDAQFVAIGWELMEQVLEKPYCHPSRNGKECNPNNPELR